MRFHPHFEYESLYAGRKPGCLEFDIEQALLAEPVEYVGQERDRLAETGVELSYVLVGEIGDASSAVGCAIEGFIMNDDEPAVARPAHVELQARGAAFEGLTKGCNCVFAIPRKARRTAVSEDNHDSSLRLKRNPLDWFATVAITFPWGIDG